MIECIFTIDYEIYGNGEGSLRELVYEPAAKLKDIFQDHKKSFVIFPEVAELEMIEAQGTDPDIALIKQQLQDFYRDGFELGLHIHPGWYNAFYENGNWHLDYSEYNLSVLPKQRIAQIIDRAISYLRKILDADDFTPFSFRAGHLLFQPSRNLASTLADRGVKVDSSIYKGGLWQQHNQDYRRALKNGYYWRFTDSINEPETQGVLLELPIYTQMVPTWKMLTSKRVGLQRKGASTAQTGKKMLSRVMDYLRFSYPLKFDLGQMMMEELTAMAEKIVEDEQKDPSSFKPVVIIGHTKDFADFEIIEHFLSYLGQKEIAVSTFEKAYERCN